MMDTALNPQLSHLIRAAAVAAALVPLTGCGVDVRAGESGRKAEVDIRTPVGDMSVRTDVKTPDTGLAVYPGARPLREDGDGPENADVRIGSSLFGVKVVAANYESADRQEQILDFYRNEMKRYGNVTECRGEVDFRGRRGAQRPVCKEKPFSRDLQIVAGTEERQRIVVVKPRGSGSEFSLVYVQTRGES
jgi:hypothetical protein